MYLLDRSITVLGVLVVVLFASAAYGAAASEVGYIVERAEGERPSFRFTVKFRGEGDGTTNFILPNEWGGQQELYKAIRGVRVISKNADITDTDKPHIKAITHRPGDEITVEYFLEQDFAGPLKNSVRYRPVVEKDHIHWIGYTVFAHPEMDEHENIRAAFDWRNFPAGWVFANSYGIKAGKQKEAFEFSELGRSITVAGNFRLTTVRDHGRRISVAIRGAWAFEDAELAEMVGRVIRTQRDFWNDHSQERYLVTLAPIDEGPNAYSYGGTGLRDSFALFATPNATLPGLRGLLAHEYFHNWNPTALGKMPEPEQQMYWLSEGFTEYYTYALLYRGGLMTFDEYIAEVNGRIREYYMLPTRTEPNERIVKDFWNDRDVGRLPYLRGMFFAMNLDAAIREGSGGKNSLDDVMKDIRDASRKRRVELSPASIAAFAARYAGRDLFAEMDRSLIRGELIAPAAHAFGDRAALVEAKLAVWEPGFDVEAMLKTRTISGVDAGSHAYEAGLRDGQKVTGPISIYFGNTERMIELTVREGDRERTVSFLPVARERLSVPQFAAAKDQS